VSVRPSVRIGDSSAPNVRIFVKFDRLFEGFRDFVEDINVSLKTDKNNWLFT
jgi:hypothetical protein